MANLPTRPIVFHSFALSGHAHRVAMFLSILGLPVERVEVDLAGGEQHMPAFRASNPFRQAPVRAHALLAIMEAQSSIQDFLAGSSATLADLANYAYIAHAPEGGVSPAGYPSVRAWLARIEGLPGFVPMKASPLARHAA